MRATPRGVVAGSVFAEGGGWRIAMGDTASGAAAAVGQVAVVGLTELGDLNNITYIANGGTAFVPGGGVAPVATADPSILITRTADPFRYTVSLSNPSGATTAWAFGIDRKTDRLRLSVGVEGQAAGARHVAGGIALFRGPVTLRALAGVIRDKGVSYRQGAVSARYTSGPLSVAVFAADDSALGLGASARAVGIGAEYDIGPSLTLKGGAVRNLTTGRNSFDLGLAMTF